MVHVVEVLFPGVVEDFEGQRPLGLAELGAEAAVELLQDGLADAVLVEVGQLLDVGARDEALLPATGDDQGPLRGILAERPGGVLDLGQGLAVQGIQHLGALDAQDRDRVAALDDQVPVLLRGARGHGSELSG